MQKTTKTQPKCKSCNKKTPHYRESGTQDSYHFCYECAIKQFGQTSIECSINPCIVCKSTIPSYRQKGTDEKFQYCKECAESLFGKDIEIKSKKCVVCNTKQVQVYVLDGVSTKKTHCISCAKASGNSYQAKAPSKKPEQYQLCVVCRTTRASWGEKGGSKKDGKYCKKCCLNIFKDGVDLRNRKCDDCHEKQPNYTLDSFPDLKFCSSCAKARQALSQEERKEDNSIEESKEESKVSIKDKITKCQNCKRKAPHWGVKNGTKKDALYCKECAIEVFGEDGCSDLSHNKCCICKENRSNFNFLGFPEDFCSKCKEKGMVIFPKKKCQVKGCNKFATHGQTKSHRTKCSEHKEDKDKEFVSSGKQQCSVCLEEEICINDICSFCSSVARQISSQSKKREEIKIKDFLEEHNFKFTHDKVIQLANNCIKNRPDFIFDQGSYFVVLEVDEHQHKRYKQGTEDCPCEVVRMWNICEALQQPCVFIRYNCHSFIGSEKTVTKFSKVAARLKVLKNDLDYFLNPNFRHKIESGEDKLWVKYLFYDNHSEEDKEFSISF